MSDLASIDRAHLHAVADLALELIASAFGRGLDQVGPDDKRIDAEARAILAIRRGDIKAVDRSLRAFKAEREAEAAELERQYGRRE